MYLCMSYLCQESLTTNTTNIVSEQKQKDLASYFGFSPQRRKTKTHLKQYTARQIRKSLFKQITAKKGVNS